MNRKSLLYVLLPGMLLTACNTGHSERKRIKQFAVAYVSTHAEAGETYHWNRIERKQSGVLYGNRHCEYAQVTFYVSQENGQERLDTLYLLLSDRCKKLINVSSRCDEHIMPYPTVSEQDIKELVQKTVTEELHRHPTSAGSNIHNQIHHVIEDELNKE